MSWRDEINDAIAGATGGHSGYYRVNCPACDERVGKPDYKASVSVNLNNGWWRCWRCDWRGRLEKFDDDDTDWDDDGWEDVEEEPEIEIEKPSEYYELPGTAYVLRPPRQYLQMREVPEVIWKQARLGYAMNGKHRHRIIMPIWRGDGTWVGWVGRHIGKSPIKYWTAKGMDRRSLFYNDIALGRAGDIPLLVSEGPLDALRHWPDSVSCLGKPTPDHIDRLRKCERPVIMALDGDAWSECYAIAQVLRRRGKQAFALRLPAGEDLDTTDPQLVRSGIRFAMENETDVELRG